MDDGNRLRRLVGRREHELVERESRDGDGDERNEDTKT
jgi:hypothetical protein